MKGKDLMRDHTGCWHGCTNSKCLRVDVVEPGTATGAKVRESDKDFNESRIAKHDAARRCTFH